MANTETQAAGAATAEAAEGGLLDQILTQSKIARSDSERSRARDLIAEHLEPDVVEVYGVGALALADDPALRAQAARVEVSGETVFFYTQDAQPLLQALAAHPQLRTLHRPANLEDLFLKLTGRQIREGG